MLREQLFAEMGTDALWSDLVRPSRSLLGQRRIAVGERPDPCAARERPRTAVDGMIAYLDQVVRLSRRSLL